MAVFNLFSKRQKQARGEVPDVYTYDSLPQPFRVQVVHIIRDAFGIDHYSSNYAKKSYQLVKDILCREYGLFELVPHPRSDEDSVFKFFLAEQSVERALDVIELSFRVMVGNIQNNREYARNTIRTISPEDAIVELNNRFKEHGIGYQFESNELIRVDSEFLHAEAVKPTLTVLRGEGFAGANQEFLAAHEHYRHGRHKESLVDALKAFESTMKAIIQLRRWQTKPNDTAKALIATCLSNGLLPDYFETQASSIRILLESGIPTLRNKNGGHGQGPDPVEVPAYYARYVLNLTATTILFLVEAHNALR
ncbi:STM4504/CBY_0614 family protein [Sapientia aquatica]|uniref:Abortive infection protein-like C-terminal domain-containing protein n=1 Tax=Sapientia aquatica TaxID=1549640 RepID=A0A4R5W1E8_9BURK|nr:hypothetical protein [Sapientia aquatica]TDK65986.1 hypothetical protein E2I14_10350 [Sapientia aquatica]